MLDRVKVSNLVQELNANIPFLAEIHSESEHKQALELMEDLLEDYDDNLPLIEMLIVSIERYESSAPEFDEFNRVQEGLDAGVVALRVLMNQYDLKIHDFEEEIGKKSLVSQILNGKKNLTKNHISALSKRFDVSPALFF